MSRTFPFRPVAFDAPVGAVVAQQAATLGLPDLGVLCGMIRWGNRPSAALEHHQALGDLPEVLVLHLVSGASPRDVGRLAARWCAAIPTLERWPAVHRVVVLAQQAEPDADILLELARVLVAKDTGGASWIQHAVGYAALLVCRHSRIGAAEHAWKAGSALTAVLQFQLGALNARPKLVELARQPLGAPA